MIKNKLIITGILALSLSLGIVSSNKIIAKATIKDSLAKYEKDTYAIEHIDLWLNSPIANSTNIRYNAKTVEHMKLLKAYLTATNQDEKSKLMIKINEVQEEQNKEKAFYDFFKENKSLTQSLQDKAKKLSKQGKLEEALLYTNKKMDLMKELYANKDTYKNPKLIDNGLNSYWQYDK